MPPEELEPAPEMLAGASSEGPASLAAAAPSAFPVEMEINDLFSEIKTSLSYNSNFFFRREIASFSNFWPFLTLSKLCFGD